MGFLQTVLIPTLDNARIAVTFGNAVNVDLVPCRKDVCLDFSAYRVENKRLAGQYGVENVTVQNLEIVRVDVERNCLLIKGSVPGPNGSVVTINDTVK